MNLDGEPLDPSRRHPITRALTLPQDSAVIEDYSNPAFVPGGPAFDPAQVAVRASGLILVQ